MWTELIDNNNFAFQNTYLKQFWPHLSEQEKDFILF